MSGVLCSVSMTQITELASMLLPTITETNGNILPLSAGSSPEANQAERILAALGLRTGGLPKVDQETLARY